MDRLRIDYPIVVEGKYDKLHLLSVLDARIFTTEGFGIFNDTDKKALIRRLAEKGPIIIATDPDNAGLLIRGYFKSVLPAEKLIHVYLPQVKGREKRKRTPKDGGDGYLGLEGIAPCELRERFEMYSSDAPTRNGARGEITATDLYLLGLSGRENALSRRKAVMRALGLPDNLGTPAFLSAINILFERDAFLEEAKKITDSGENNYNGNK